MSLEMWEAKIKRQSYQERLAAYHENLNVINYTIARTTTTYRVKKMQACNAELNYRLGVEALYQRHL